MLSLLCLGNSRVPTLGNLLGPLRVFFHRYNFPALAPLGDPQPTITVSRSVYLGKSSRALTARLATATVFVATITKLLLRQTHNTQLSNTHYGFTTMLLPRNVKNYPWIWGFWDFGILENGARIAQGSARHSRELTSTRSRNELHDFDKPSCCWQGMQTRKETTAHRSAPSGTQNPRYRSIFSKILLFAIKIEGFVS